VVLLEAPTRVLATLQDLAEAMEGPRRLLQAERQGQQLLAVEPLSSGETAPAAVTRGPQPRCRPVLVCRELTKLHEAVTRFESLSDAAAAMRAPCAGGEGDSTPLHPQRGEFTLVLLPEVNVRPGCGGVSSSGSSDNEGGGGSDGSGALAVSDAVALALELIGAGATPRDAVDRVAALTGASRRGLYSALLARLPPLALNSRGKR
jgi:16S rRNA C1402 (ribose-2'-O) methylase RsmI